MSGYPPRVAPGNRREDPADDAAVSVVDEPPGDYIEVDVDEQAVRDSDDGDDGVPPKKQKKHSRVRTVVEWVIVLGAAIAVALILRTFVLSAFYIPSGSMEPTLDVGDRVLVNKLSYKMHDVNRGDVIVFERPPGETDSSIKDLIKRVIALPGETVEGHDGVVYVCESACTTPSQEGRPLTEGYVNPVCRTNTDADFGPIPLTDSQVWVMGDNRCGSSDSRVFGPIETDTIVGRAFVIVYPLSDLGWL